MYLFSCLLYCSVARNTWLLRRNYGRKRQDGRPLIAGTLSLVYGFVSILLQVGTTVVTTKILTKQKFNKRTKSPLFMFLSEINKCKDSPPILLLLYIYSSARGKQKQIRVVLNITIMYFFKTVIWIKALFATSNLGLMLYISPSSNTFLYILCICWEHYISQCPISWFVWWQFRRQSSFLGSLQSMFHSFLRET